MNNFFIAPVIMAAAALMAAGTAKAQYKLPTPHDKQHSELLASQKPLSTDIKVSNVLRYISELNKTAKPELSDVYGQYWESQNVNPYGGVEIPAIQDIDVSGYYHPVPGAVTSNYGYRPRFGRVHRGIDLRLSIGDTVRAAFDGKIRLTKFERRGYGYYVVMRHDNGMETVYGHLSKFLVKPDQWVKAGDPIALGGNTGRSTGPHLHFETRFMGVAINPTAIIDFENKVTHKDVFTFDKKAYEKSQNYRPSAKKKARKSRTTARAKKSTKKRK